MCEGEEAQRAYGHFVLTRRRLLHEDIQDMDVIALSIPVFFIFMGVEWGVAKWRGIEIYRLADFIANLGCGVVQQTSKIFIALITTVGYLWLYNEHRIYTLSTNSWWTWVLCFFGVDFFYYWFHRMSHEHNLLWAAHVVHHQSEEYNLSVALRQSAFQALFSWFFYLPLAVLGFSPWMVAITRALSALYQFWIHTQLIDRMGPLEWILNTPSHHRVHHGKNPQYIDRNHAGTLIIWDRIFGTFEPEGDEVIYGVTEPPQSWNPIFVNFHHIKLSCKRMIAAHRWDDKWNVWWAQPGYTPQDRDPKDTPCPLSSKYETNTSTPILVYVSIQFSLLLIATISYLLYQKLLTPWVVVGWAMGILATAGSLGALLDNRPWSQWAEAARLVLLPIGFAVLFPASWTQPLPLFALIIITLFSAYGLRHIRY